MPHFSAKKGDYPLFYAVTTTAHKLPPLPFEDIKNTVLGKNYDLSLVACGDARTHTLNRTYKELDKPASILSFPLEDDAGEIYLNLPMAKRRIKQYGIPYRDVVGFLFIHGVLHLKGYTHGSTMERREEKLCKQFAIAYPE